MASQTVFTLPSAAAIALAAARGWPGKAVEPYASLLTLQGAGPGLRSGVPKARVRVVFSPAHDRRPHRSDANIEAVWSRRLAAAEASGGRLFDMSKFRLARIGWSDRRCDQLRIDLGLTSYKEYVATNQLPDAERKLLESSGSAAYGDAGAHLSNALGCETLLLTSDDQVVFLRRSAKVSSGEGLYNGPSGHAEPSHAGIKAHGAPLDGSGAPVEGHDASVEDRVLAELFGAMRLEVHEETNVPLSALGEPLLIGAMCDESRKPDLLFLTRTSLDGKGVRAAYARGATEGWESDKLALFPVQRLDSCAETLPLTAVTRAAVACFACVTTDVQSL